MIILGRAHQEPAYGVSDVRRKGGVSLIQASVRNVGTCRSDVKGEPQVGGPHKRESTDAEHRGGVTRSSDEGSVMELERRGDIVLLDPWVNLTREESDG